MIYSEDKAFAYGILINVPLGPKAGEGDHSLQNNKVLVFSRFGLKYSVIHTLMKMDVEQ